MRYFPIFLDLENVKVVVAGGGETAAQKVRLLLKTPADIHVFADHLNEELAAHAAAGKLRWHERPVRERDLDGAGLVYVADVDIEDSDRIVNSARARQVPVNVVDDPVSCSFLTPSIVDRSPVVVAIGTEGAAPVLARALKTKIDALLPSALGGLADFARSLRKRVGKSLHDGRDRRTFWEAFFDGAPARKYLAGDRGGAETAVTHGLSAGVDADKSAIGHVSLVGAGPGDPDLLTLKAQQRLQAADVIVYDRLIGPDILDFARRDAQRISVGKTPGAPSISQEEINRILVREALAGKFVVRLKGGDPYVFGRGGEEQDILQSTGIPFDVVPGITAAAGCAASVGLPLTTRGQNRAITLLTGATSQGPAEHDWPELAKPGAAFAIYMGVRTAPHISSRLLDAGINPTTPVVLVQNGTLPNERVAVTTIGSLTTCVRQQKLSGPAVIFVGLRPSEALRAHTFIDRNDFENGGQNVVEFAGEARISGGAA